MWIPFPSDRQHSSGCAGCWLTHSDQCEWLLTTAEPQAALTHHCLVALWEARRDALMDGGRLRSLIHVLVRCARTPIPVTHQQRSTIIATAFCPYDCEETLPDICDTCDSLEEHKLTPKPSLLLCTVQKTRSLLELSHHHQCEASI